MPGRPPERILVAQLSERRRRLIGLNGAGPKGLGWLVPDFWFRAAADQHDLDYWQGHRLRDKAVADVRFFAGCVEAALASAARVRAWRVVARLALCVVYYVAVVLLGWWAFHWRSRRGWGDIMQLEWREEQARPGARAPWPDPWQRN